MIVECINNDQALAPNVHENGYRHPQYVHTDLTVGSRYFVYGIHIWSDDLRFLIQNDRGDARWTSPYFFEVREPRLPPHWEFQYVVIEGEEQLERIGRRAVWGYPALVNDPRHNDNLQYTDSTTVRIAEDLKIFEQEVARRAELGY